jgi:hypothetical protein
MDEYPEEGAVLVLALAAPTQAPMQPSDEQIDAVTSRVLGLELRRDLARVFARAVLALAAPTQAPMQPSVTRSTVIEWLDALNIEVTYKQLDGLFAAPTQAAPAAQPCKHGIRPAVDCSICLLPIAAAPAAAGSWDEHMQAMDKGWIYSASLRLADEVAGSTNVRIYAQGLAVKASEHARNIRAYLAAPAAAVEPDVSGWDPDQDVWHGDKPAAAAPEGLTFTLTADDAELLQGWISNVPVAEGSEVWQMLDRLHIALESPAAVEPKP